MKYDKELRYEIDTHDCWIWSGAKNPDGYGILKYQGKNYLAHRFSYMQNKGKIGWGLEVRHTCHNPSCINIDHLLLGTHQQNIQDREGRKKQFCRGGHELNSSNNYRYNNRIICKICKAQIAARM
uniref:HNH endonuclease signature motif containing protein n=1 Tax=Rhodococcus sp. H36-A4 TaxID=3004353 RepID=UPI003FA78188